MSTFYSSIQRLGLVLGLFLCTVSWASAQTTFTVCPAGPPFCGSSTIQGAVDAASDGDIVEVQDGTYMENVVVDSKDITIRSENGRATTTIEGISNAGALGAVLVEGTTAGFTLDGFTVVGIDNGAPGIENAAVYVRGSHTDLMILNNDIQANGDGGFLAEFGAMLTDPVLDGNLFTGQTFLGPNPAGEGFSMQFTLPNVPRQLVTLGNGGGTVVTANVTGLIFTNNDVTGTAGGLNTDGDEQGNTLATLDAANATITGNLFSGETTRFGAQLRIRRPGAAITGNTFESDDLGAITSHIFIQNNGAPLPTIAANNTFDKGAYAELGEAITVSINPSVFGAASGDTVNIFDATYREQVVVDGKALTIQGESTAGVIIEAPDTVPTCFTTSADNKPVVCAINDADMEILDLTVDGRGVGNSNVRFHGIAYRNAGGLVQDVVITGIRDTPLSGVQHGIALYSFNDDGIDRTIEVFDNNIVDFQKNGMALNAGTGAPLTLDVQRNTVTGAGPIPTTAQNGIQTFGDAIVGVVDDNVILGIAYTGSGFVATSILNFNSAIDAAGNDVDGAQTGMYWFDGQGTMAGNDIEVIDAGDFSFGIVATDPPRAVPSPFDPPSTARSGGGGTIVVNVLNNTVTFTGGDNTSSFGIEADAGFGADDLDLTISGNDVGGFEVGVEIFECQTGCQPTSFSSLLIELNNLDGNDIAIRSNFSQTVDAPANYYGDIDPSDDVVGDVDFSPWLEFPVGTSPQTLYTDQFIQEAVEYSDDGDTILALAGTYAEQVIVDDLDLTITGAGTGSTTIIAPAPAASLDTCFTTSGPNKTVVCAINGSDLTLEELTVDGDGQAGNARFYGVAIYNSSGIVRNTVVQGMRATPLSGNQAALGIFGGGDSASGPYDIVIENNLVQDFGKNGITVDGADVTTTIDGNTVIGSGSVDELAQNGIQVSRGTGGTVSNNMLSALSFDPVDESRDGFDAGGILLFNGSDVVVQGNTITSCEGCLLAADTPAMILDNVITTSTASSDDDDYTGVFAYSFVGDPGARVAQGKGELEPQQQHLGSPALVDLTAPQGNPRAGTIAYEVIGNTLTGGTDNSGVGLLGFAFQDGTSSMLDFRAEENTVNGFDTGVYICEGEDGLVLPVDLDGFNDLSGNNTALYTCLANDIDAENNDWGVYTPAAIAALIENDGAGTVDFIPFVGSSRHVDLTTVATSSLTFAAGDSATFKATIVNFTSNVVTGDLYFVAERNGNEVSRGVIQSGGIAPNDTIMVNFEQDTPASSPPGDYIYRVRIGGFPNTVVDEDAFAVTIQSSGSRAVGGDDVWSVRSTPWLSVDEFTAMQEAGDDAMVEVENLDAAASEVLPTEFAVTSAPNPATHRATLHLALPEAGVAKVTVYDVRGREVAVAVDRELEAGTHAIGLDVSNLASGVYIVRAQSASRIAVQRITVVR